MTFFDFSWSSCILRILAAAGKDGTFAGGADIAADKKLYSVVDLDGPVATVHCKVDDEGQATVTINQDDLEKIKAHAEAEWRFQKQYPAIMGE